MPDQPVKYRPAKPASPHRDPPPGEGCKTVLADKVEQAAHNEDGRDEGGNEADADDRRIVHGQDVSVLEEIIGKGAGHGGHREKERKLRRRALVRAHQKSARDGRARARNARHHGQRLAKADGHTQPQRIVHCIVITRLQRHLVDHQQDDPADDERGADQRGAIQTAPS
jgi:hypothetical protein